MKKMICLISTAVVLAGFSAQATTLNEWNFYFDPAGKTLSQAFNSKGSAVFSSGGAGFLETDGLGALLCTYNDPGTTGMWTNGAILDAATSNLTTGIFFLRYDLEYDLSATNNDSGTLAGFAFTDATGAQVAGVALKYDVGATTAPTNLTVTELTDLGTNRTGKVSFIAKVDMSTHKMAVWYDLTGTGSFSADTNPQTNNVSVNLLSIRNLHLQATGDFRPAGSSDFVKVKLLRMSDSFADAAAAGPTVPPAKYSNEWTFERDLNGRQLSDTINSGTNSPLARFGAGFGNTVFTTNRALRCIGEDAGTNGVWTNGAILDAAILPSSTSGVHYLRYDVTYNLSSPSNNSGTVLGVYFTGATNDKVAGVVLGYDKGNLTNSLPVGRSLVAIPGATDLTNNGTLTAIAEVDLGASTLKVWYGLNGLTPTNYNAPAFTNSIALTSITNLRFQATGDFRPAGSTDYADVDNIRHIVSSSAGGIAWSNIIDSVANLSLPPVLQLLVTNSLSGSMELGETNIVTAIISNTGGGSASSVYSILSGASAFSVTSNNAPVSLPANASITNTYTLIANASGRYNLTIQAISTETNSAPIDFSIIVGSHISYLTNSILPISGNTVPGKYVPGETISITVSSTNDGARTVTNIVNTLSANPTYFTIAPSSATYSSMSVGQSTSTVYTVGINNTTPPGTYTFSVTNQAGSMVWTNSFTLDVFQNAIPSVTPSSLILNVVAGSTNSASVIVTNGGNGPLTFTVTDNATWGSVYSVNTNATYSWEISSDKITLIYTNAGGLSPLDYGYSTNLPIGFGFPLYGTVYSNFFVTADGAIGLGAEANSLGNGGTGILPSSGDQPLVAPFWRNLRVGSNSITYAKASDRLIITYTGVTNVLTGGGGGTNLSFQTILYTNGTVKFQYKTINGAGLDTMNCGIQGSSSNYLNTGFIPASGKAVLITPVADIWVTRSPSSGTVPAGGSTNVTFTANATGRTAGTTLSITNLFTWTSSGGSTSVTVNVSVQNANPALTASPTNIVFSGQAGSTTTNSSLVVSNNGNIAVDFTISDTAAAAVTYSGSVSNSTAWDNVATGSITNWLKPDANRYTTADDEGFSPLINIGFEFEFYGAAYTQLSIGVNGGLSVGTTNRISAVNDFSTERPDVPNQFIAPYWGDLQLGSNSTVRYQTDGTKFVVSWLNMQQRGIPAGTNLSFQAVLYKTGEIEFRYKQINGGRWAATPVGLRSVGKTPVSTNLFFGASDTYLTTNFVGGTTNTVIRTNVVNAIANRSVRYIPGTAPIITYTPSTGNIPVGMSTNILIIGNASSLTPGGTNTLANNTLLTIAYASTNTTVGVLFTITNSLETALAALPADAMDTDGDGISDDDERMAGTDPLDPNSMFLVSTDGGTRTLRWGYAVGRIYKVWWTSSLTVPFELLETVEDDHFTDTIHQDLPVVFYKVTVE